MKKDLKDSIDTVKKIVYEMSSLYHTAAVKTGISDGEIAVWNMLLFSEENYSQKDLAETLFMSKQTVNSIVSSMAKRGLVELKHMPGTRNLKVIKLTEAGKQFAADNVQWIFEADERAMEKTDLRELRAVISLLDKYVRNLKEELSRTEDSGVL